jgi:hypothetical protein
MRENGLLQDGQVLANSSFRVPQDDYVEGAGLIDHLVVEDVLAYLKGFENSQRGT